MARSVVLAGTDRCDGCRMPPRWCICEVLLPVKSPLAVAVVIHQREQWRPTSTGRLVLRCVEGAAGYVFQRDTQIRPELEPSPERETWILHPHGEWMGEGSVSPGDASRIRILLLDGSWPEAGQMLRRLEGVGRAVRLPLAEVSRNRLREQQAPGRLSTAEALMGFYRACGLTEAEGTLRLNMEFHVYATLRARGKKYEAAEFLRESPIRQAFPDFLERLNERRPNVAG